MQRLEVSGAVRPLYGSFGVKGLIYKTSGELNMFVRWYIIKKYIGKI